MIEAQRTELRARQTILRDVLLSLTFSPTRPRRTRGFICRSRGGTWRSQEHAVKEALACSQWRRSLSDISTRFASHLGTRPRLGILRHALTTFANLLKLGRLDLSAAI
jgi:hypothetical protein